MSTNRLNILAVALATCATLSVAPAATASDEGLPHVLVHRPFDAYYSCGEHREGELPYPGDDLGADCVVQELVEVEGRTWARLHRGKGLANEDWYGWRQEVLAPITGEVARIQLNEKTNEPGVLGEPPATFVVLKRDDGVSVLLAHLRELEVAQGDRVEAGQVIGRVGNNGYGRTPHVHIGAWQGDTALQLRFDLRKGPAEEATEPAQR